MKIITYLCCFVVFYALTYAEPIKKNVINGLEVLILPKNYVIPKESITELITYIFGQPPVQISPCCPSQFHVE